MSNEEAELFLWIFGGLVGLILLCFALYLIGDHCSYEGGGGSGYL